MPKPTAKPPSMKPGEMQRELIRLGLTLEQAAYALALSYEHVRALADGRSRVREPLASILRQMTLLEASNTRVAWWQEVGFAKRHGAPAKNREE